VDEQTLDLVQKELRGINANADIILTRYSEVEASRLINIGAFKLEKVLEMDPEFLDTDGEHQHDLSVSSVSIRFEGELKLDELKRWIQKLLQDNGPDLFRYKGVLAVKGTEDKYVFQGVHMIFNGSFDGRFKWKKDEVRESRLVFIGRNLDKEALQKGVMGCR